MKNILEYQWLLLPVVVFLSFFIRYTAIAGGMYWVFYVWKKDKFYKRKNQLPFPDKGQVRYEIKWSLYSSIVMGFIGTSVYYAYKHGYTRVYENISDMGWGYYIFSIFFMMFIHDIYFYFMHRLLHKKFMWKIHSVHHYCKNPTPWSSFCMHPVEMLMVGGIVAPMLFVIPAHMSAFFIFAKILLNKKQIFIHEKNKLF